MLGRCHVVFWLERRGIPTANELVDRVFARAKASERVLTEEEILTVIADFRSQISD